MNSILEKIYSKSPIAFQNYFISLYGKKLYKQRYTSTYSEYLKYLKSRDLSDIQKQKEIQNELFLKFLHFAYENSPFYREFYKDVDLSRIKSVDDIGLLPILDKETLRLNINKVHTITSNNGIKSFTGGTSGKSLSVYFTHEDNQKRMAYLDWFKWLHGFEMNKTSSARFNGKNIIPLNQKSKVFWRDNKYMLQRIYSSFYLSPENIEYYVNNLNEYKPTEIDGFCSSMYDIAKFMNDNGIKSEFSPIVIFPTSETILPHHREMLEKVFNAPVRDQYASSEGAPFIIECAHGHMHECLDTGVFEHVHTDNGTKLILTSFTTHGTPLIRYDIEDYIIESDECDCHCEISFPIIKAIDGRAADSLYSAERGNISIANLSNVVKNLPNSVKNIQYIQNTSDHINIKIVVDKNKYIPKHEKAIINEMKFRFGDKMTFSIEKVNEIPRAKSGKYQMIINNLSKR